MAVTPQQRFDQDRKDWATSADALADQCYQEYYGVGEDDLYDLESLVDSVHDRQAGYETHQIIDYGGVDRIVDCGVRHVYISQRFRPNKREFRDLSLRTDNGVDGRHSELTKWMTAFESHGFFPNPIAFGLYDDVLEVFSEFYLLDTATILDGLSNGALAGEENDTGDGTAALYIDTDDLREIGAVIEYWDGVK